MIMVKAGAPVDAVIGQLAPLLEKGDVIIDGGNSLFTDTQRRCKDLEGTGIHFVGCGVSGGEEGALKGPSLMPGGSRESWEIIAPIFTQDRRAGRWRTLLPLHGTGWRRSLRQDGAQRNRVRRHAADLRGLRDSERRPRIECRASFADIFAEWNKGDLDSYLIDITVADLSQNRSRTPASRSSTSSSIRRDKKEPGIWTLQSAIQQSVVISTINAAVEARVISSRKEERVAASEDSAAAEGPKHSTAIATRLDRRRARRALRFEDRFLRPGDGAARRRPARNSNGT